MAVVHNIQHLLLRVAPCCWHWQKMIIVSKPLPLRAQTAGKKIQQMLCTMLAYTAYI